MRFLLRRLIATVLTVFVFVIAAVALLLAIEFRLPLDDQRVAIAAAASRSLGTEVSISGPLYFITGAHPGIEAGGLHVAGRFKDRQISIDSRLAGARLHWRALLGGEIRFSEIGVEAAKVCVATPAGAPTEERAPSERDGGTWQLTGIDTLRIEIAALGAGSDCAALPGTAQLHSLALSASGGEALQIAAAGTIAGEAWHLELTGPTLQSLIDPSAPVPFKLAVGSAEGKLSADGKLLLSPLSAEADVVFDSPQFVVHVREMGAPLKDFGPLSVRAHVRADANRLALRLDEARLTPGTVSGEFSFDWSGALPRLAAHARTDKLDVEVLQRWLGDSIDVERLHPGRLQRQIIAGVRASTGSLAIDVGRVAAGRAAFDAALIDGSWDAGKGRASFGARFDRTPIKGTFDADVRSDVLSFAATVATGAIALRQKGGVSATASRIDAKLSARGQLGADLAQGLRGKVEARNAKLMLPRDGGEDLAISLDSIRADWQARDRLRVATAGTALGERFNAHVEGADALRLIHGEPWQLQASGSFGPLRLETKGKLALLEGRPVAQLDVTAASAALGSLVPDAISKLPLDMRGRVELEQAAWRVDLASLRLGKTQGSGKVSGSLPFAVRPLAAQATFQVLDLTEFAADAGSGDPWERQWLPGKLALPDADIAFRAARIATSRGVIAKVEVNAKTRGGRLEQAPFALEMDGSAIRGNLAADLREESAQVSARIETGALEKWLAAEHASDGGVRIKVGSTRLTATATGNRLRELAASADLRIDLRDAHAAIERSGKGARLELALSNAAISAASGSPTRLKTSGTFVDQPLSIEASSEPLASWLPPGNAPRPFSLSGQVAGLDLAAKGEIPADGAIGELALDVRIGAERLDALGALLNADLPAVGPFTLEAVRSKSAKGVVAADIKFVLGESSITGRVAGRPKGKRPAFDVDLTSKLLRLEDLGAKALALPTAESKDAKRLSPKQPSAKDLQRAQALLDEAHRILRKFDAQVHLALARITAGGKDYARADVVAKLESGRLRLAPVRVDGAGGAALDAELEADLASEDTGYRFAATIDRFRYGKLMKSIDAKHPADGELSLKLKLTGRGALATIGPTLEGDAGLVIFPSGLPSAWMDKLGGGLLRNIGTSLDGKPDSKLNCAVATFHLEKGRAKSAALMLDSTRVRAAGELEINLANGTLQGQMVPKSKHAELFATQAPLVISGTLDAPKIGLLTGALAVAAARYYFFAYAFLFDAATSGQLAEDGRPDCVAAYERLAK